MPEAEKLSITSMYLMGDAKLWWRTRVGEDSKARRPRVAKWETLKKELNERFLSMNVVWLAREPLKRLKHTGSVQDYVKEFSSLMLDIRNMSEEAKFSSPDYRDGHKQNFEGREFVTYLLQWLQQIAWWITRWSMPSTPCRKPNRMVGKSPRLMGRGMAWLWSRREGRTCNRHPSGLGASFARVCIKPRHVQRGRRCLLSNWIMIQRQETWRHD